VFGAQLLRRLDGPARPVVTPTDQTFSTVTSTDVERCGVRYIRLDANHYGVQFPLRTQKRLVKISGCSLLYEHVTLSGVVYERRYHSWRDGRYLVSVLSCDIGKVPTQNLVSVH
jgi:hypothetical protein